MSCGKSAEMHLRLHIDHIYITKFASHKREYLTFKAVFGLREPGLPGASTSMTFDCGLRSFGVSRIRLAKGLAPG